MSSKPDDETAADVETMIALTVQTEAFVNKILDDAKARDFCPGCALEFVARLLAAACQVNVHGADAIGDLPPTDFDDTPGHG